MWTSPDCVNWTLEPAIDAFRDGMITAIARGGPGYIAAGYRSTSSGDRVAVWTSPDGQAWTRVPDDQLVTESGFSVGDMINDLESLDGRLVAQGWSDKAGLQTFWISDDGVQWNRVESFDRFRVNSRRVGPVSAGGHCGRPRAGGRRDREKP